ncbi:MAG: DUF885 domain-containing protein [Nitriliruptor sp.]|nr:MAG: DUF885 domain-containing protein [Nitriliruptor sp.]
MEQPEHRAERLVLRYLEVVARHEPVEATRIGLQGLDGELPDLDPAALAARSRDLAVLAAETTAARTALVGQSGTAAREARGDLELLGAELEFRRYQLDVRPRLLLDPLAVLDTVAAAVHELLAWDDGTPGDRCRRLEAASKRARRVPVLLEQASGLLATAPAPHLEVALQRLPGLLTLVRDVLPQRAEELGVDVSPARDAGEVAAEGLEAFAALLDELGDDQPGEWRLGPEQHATVLRSALGTVMDPAQIEDRARTWIARVRERLAEETAVGWQQRFPGVPLERDVDARIRATLAAIADTAVERGALLQEASRAIAEARTFAIQAGLVDVPPAERLRVREVPPYLRGLAVAFVTQPPPLRPGTGCTYYLSPVPAEWSDAQARAFLRAFSPAALRSLAIHEGYPGHVVQLEHAALHPRLARRLLARPVFAEGWAVYIEREAAAAGFGSDTSSTVGVADYRAIHLRNELRIATAALVDVGLHAGELTDDDAAQLLVRAAYQEPAEARATVLRAQVTSGQLSSYFVGGEELTDLRAQVERREGAGFDLEGFHQRVLSHGTPTVPLLSAALADDAPVRRPFATRT